MKPRVRLKPVVTRPPESTESLQRRKGLIIEPVKMEDLRAGDVFRIHPGTKWREATANPRKVWNQNLGKFTWRVPCKSLPVNTPGDTA